VGFFILGQRKVYGTVFLDGIFWQILAKKVLEQFGKKKWM
jgi:hypothetical protein